MLESKLSKWVLYKVLAFMIFFFIVLMPFYIEELDRKNTIVIWPDFFKTLGILIVCAAVVFLITLSGKAKVLILENKIILGNYLTSSKKEISFSEISGMTWMNKNKSYRSLRGVSTSVNLQEFSIYLKDSNSFNIAKKDYDNYEELANWFFGYCRKHEIIKLDPLEVRKRSRYRRPEKVKKL